MGFGWWFGFGVGGSVGCGVVLPEWASAGGSVGVGVGGRFEFCEFWNFHIFILSFSPTLRTTLRSDAQDKKLKVGD